MADAQGAALDFKVLFEQSPGQYLILDPQFRILGASDAYCQVAKVRRDEIVGRDVFAVFPDDTSRSDADGPHNLRASLTRVLKFRRPDAMATQRYDIERPQEEGGGFVEKYWSPMNAPVLNEDGGVRWIVHRVHDVTEFVKNPDADESRAALARDQQSIIQRLRAANEELARIDALRVGLMQMSRLNTIATMAAALAHDISQPLAAATNYLGALRHTAPTEGTTETLVAKIDAQIGRAIDIVKNLRKFVSTGATEHRPEALAPVLHEAVKLAEPVIRSSGATAICGIDPELPHVMVDRVQIQQVVVNLLSNAAEAVRACALREIRISAHAAGDMIQIDVADSGTGLPDEVARKLFEPFTTTKLTGMGLGLPICRQIVGEHGGKMWAAPNRPSGTIFSFTIPAVEAQTS